MPNFSFNYWDNEPRTRALLSREDVEACIDFELMAQGILKVEQPTLLPILPLEMPTEPYFKVRSDYTDIVCFKTMAEADTFLGLQAFKADYNYECGGKIFYAKALPGLTVERVQLASEADYINRNKVMKENKSAEAANEKAMAEFRKDCAATESATNGLFEDWHDQQSTERKNQRILATYLKYIAMAKNDHDIAMGFLEKAFSPNEVQEAQKWLGEEWVAAIDGATDTPGSPKLRPQDFEGSPVSGETFPAAPAPTLARVRHLDDKIQDPPEAKGFGDDIEF